MIDEEVFRRLDSMRPYVVDDIERLLLGGEDDHDEAWEVYQRRVREWWSNEGVDVDALEAWITTELAALMRSAPFGMLPYRIVEMLEPAMRSSYQRGFEYGWRAYKEAL